MKSIQDSQITRFKEIDIDRNSVNDEVELSDEFFKNENNKTNVDPRDHGSFYSQVPLKDETKLGHMDYTREENNSQGALQLADIDDSHPKRQRTNL